MMIIIFIVELIILLLALIDFINYGFSILNTTTLLLVLFNMYKSIKIYNIRHDFDNLEEALLRRNIVPEKYYLEDDDDGICNFNNK